MPLKLTYNALGGKAKFSGTSGRLKTVYTKPQIIPSGLILNLDAGNTLSYPGTGTIWTDLSGNNNSGSLINGPTFSTDNGGSIVFDGTNDYVLLPTNFFNNNAGTPFTVSFWFKTSTNRGVLFGQSNATSPSSFATGYTPGLYIDSNGKLATSCFWGGSTTNISTSTGIVTDGTWKNATVTFQSTSQVSYLNGSSYATISKTQTSYSSTYYYFIGSGEYASWPSAFNSPYFTGLVSKMIFYNRALTASEVLYNYNIDKARFGL